MQPDADRSDVADALLRASRALVGVAARSLADVDEVTLPQFRALVVLSSRGATAMTDLAHALDVHPTTATRLCDRLVDKGLIRREQGIDDRRATEIVLTTAGQKLVGRVTNRRRRDLEAIADRMEPAAALAAVRSLQAFADAAGEPSHAVDLFAWGAASETR